MKKGETRRQWELPLGCGIVELERADGVETRINELGLSVGGKMRKLVLTMAAVGALTAGGFAAVPRAEELPVFGNIAVPADGGLLKDAAYVCGPVWRCGRYD